MATKCEITVVAKPGKATPRKEVSTGRGGEASAYWLRESGLTKEMRRVAAGGDEEVDGLRQGEEMRHATWTG